MRLLFIPPQDSELTSVVAGSYKYVVELYSEICYRLSDTLKLLIKRTVLVHRFLKVSFVASHVMLHGRKNLQQ